MLLGMLLAVAVPASSQSKKRVNIEQADKMQYNKAVVENANRLLGNVKITHEDIVMYCDSAYSYNDSSMVDAFGNVHIIRGDTLNMYAQYIRYNGDAKWAVAKNNVKLINKNTTLTTDVLNYDLALNIAYYNDYGTVVDSTSILHSRIGEYHANEDKAYFKKNVDGQTPTYRILSDTLIYEPNTSIVTIAGPTTCYNETDTLYASQGFYDTKSGYSELHNYPIIRTAGRSINASSILYNQRTGDGSAIGDANVHDFGQKTIIRGNLIDYNELAKVSVVTDSAHVLFYTSVDTLYMYADTLQTMPDSIPNENVILGYYNVKFFRTDLQGMCDSISYFTSDSTLCLHKDPMVWSQSNQLTADYMEMLMIDSIHQEFHLENNSFIIAQEDSIRYNQIKGRNMIGYIKGKDLHRIDVDGNGQTIYYARDSKGLIGLNKAMGSTITIGLKESKVSRIAFHTKPDGQLIPPKLVSDPDRVLPNFKWEADLRPTNKYDIFNKDIERVKDPRYIKYASRKYAKTYLLEDYPAPTNKEFEMPNPIENSRDHTGEEVEEQEAEGLE